VLRCVYFDLDGTIVGRGGSLFHDENGAVSLMGARALEAAHRAGVEVVPISGRRRDTVREPGRAMGATAYGFECGGGLVVDGEDFWQTGDLRPTADGLTVNDQIVSRGVIDLLTHHFDGLLELHTPWHVGREVSVLFRGEIDTIVAQQLLNDHGSGDLRIVDNGFVGGLQTGGTGFQGGPGESTLDPSVEFPRSYHLTPEPTSKAAAVDRHRRIRGYDRADTISVGDSAEDVGMAACTGTFWLVAGAADRDPSVADALLEHDNVRHAEGGPGEAVYEAIVTTLMVGEEH
jgi:hydroxymethylpyrimidine pyrophosphatase-like HAD family hydrolase